MTRSPMTRSPMTCSALVGSLLLLGLSFASAAGAQPAGSAPPAAGVQTVSPELSAALQLSAAGQQDFNGGNYPAAQAKFDTAYQTVRQPSLGLWTARVREKQGRFLEAAQRYKEVIALRVSGADAGAQLEAQAAARTELASLESRTPHLTVTVEGSKSATVMVDNINVTPGSPMPMDPGLHRVVVSGTGAGGKPHKDQREVNLAAGANENLVVRFSGEQPSDSKAVTLAPQEEPPSKPKKSRPAISLGGDLIFSGSEQTGAAGRIGFTPDRGAGFELTALIARWGQGGALGLKVPLIQPETFDISVIPAAGLIHTTDGWFLMLEVEGRARFHLGSGLRIFAGVSPHWYVARPSTADSGALRATAGIQHTF